MRKEMIRVLESVLHYEKRGCVIGCILLIICLTAIICAAIIHGRKRPVAKIVISVIVFTLVIVFAVYIIQVNRNCDRILEDIAKAEFVTYEGEFIHDDYQKDSFYHNVYITDDAGNQIRLQLPDYGNMYGTYENYREIPIGLCTGTIVYSQNSKIITKWSAVKPRE